MLLNPTRDRGIDMKITINVLLVTFGFMRRYVCLGCGFEGWIGMMVMARGCLENADCMVDAMLGMNLRGSRETFEVSVAVDYSLIEFFID